MSYRPAVARPCVFSLRRTLAVLFCAVILLASACAQQNTTPPTLIKFSGTFVATSSGPASTAEPADAPASVSVIFALYKDQTGGAPLWQEVQTVTVDATGRYTALLGSASASGMPVDLFSGNEARWLGVQAQGQAEQARVLLVSVPYAIKAADAETLGGLPASAFVRADAAPAYVNSTAVTSAAANISASPALTVSGAKAGFLPVFTDALGDLGSSVVAQASGNIGVNTSSPAFNMHVIGAADPAAIAIEGYGAVGVNFIGRRAEGTQASPQHLNAGDNIFILQGRGYGATGFSPYSRASIKMVADQNWSDTAQGTYIMFATTPDNTAPSGSASERVRITNDGKVGIGTSAPASPLTVNGVIQSTAGGVKFPDGTVQTTAEQSNLQALSSGLSASGYSNGTFIYDTNLCMVGDIVLSANSYGSGAIPADGRLLPISQNTALFSLLGTRFGGDGVTTFAVPDLRSFSPGGLQYSICAFGIFPGRS